MKQNKPANGRPLALVSLTSRACTAASSILAHSPSMELGVKVSGGVVAAVLAMRYAGSLRSACVLGLLSGLFAHSLYADVLHKKRRRRSRKKEAQMKDVDSK